MFKRLIDALDKPVAAVFAMFAYLIYSLLLNLRYSMFVFALAALCFILAPLAGAIYGAHLLSHVGAAGVVAGACLGTIAGCCSSILAVAEAAIISGAVALIDFIRFPFAGFKDGKKYGMRHVLHQIKNSTPHIGSVRQTMQEPEGRHLSSFRIMIAKFHEFEDFVDAYKKSDDDDWEEDYPETPIVGRTVSGAPSQYHPQLRLTP